MKVSDIRECFYVPGKPGIIDAVNPDTGKGLYSRETLTEVKARYPGAVLGEFDTVCDQQDAYWISPPVRITKERFFEMLEVLPPVGWKCASETPPVKSKEVFRLSERTSGAVTAIFCRIGDRYFEMQDRIDTPFDRVIELCGRLD